MKYIGMPAGMWLLFEKSFRKNLSSSFGVAEDRADEVTMRAKNKYRRIIGSLPEFEKGDRFRMNIVSCAMLSSFLLSLPERPSAEQTTEYYRNAMMIPPMKLFCRLTGKKKFTPEDIDGMRKTEAFRAADRNPYSWNMKLFLYEDGSGYEARFTHCGICTLMKELGLQDQIPAMCRLDYTMSEAGGVSDFVREYTLASGGPYCDCGYRRKDRT